MRVVQLQAQNLKRIKAIDITPTDDLVVIAGRNASGKQQPVSEPVLTPSGWRSIGELKVGDLVIGANGMPTEVVAVHPQTERATYEVAVVDGGSTRCGPDHLWTVWTWSYSKSLRKTTWIDRTVTTRTLIEMGLLRNGTNSTSRRWALPNLSPVEFIDQGVNLPVEPYALGAILGDGHIEMSGYVTVTSADPDVLDRLIVRAGYRANRKNLEVLGTAEWSRPLAHLGLAGKLAHEKFVPEIYKWASVSDRRLLLAGLVDTDGTASTNWAEFATSSPRLAADVTDIARSLGYVCNTTISSRKYTYLGESRVGLDCHIVRIRRGPCPFGLGRKVAKWRPSKRGETFRFIKSIDRVADEDSVCIEVAASDGLYVTKDFIVTHNTSVLDSIWWALAGASSFSDSPDPIRHGQKNATARVDLGEMVVTRTWSAAGTTKLTVTAKDGSRYTSPQSMLDGLIGSLSFDPLAFANTDAKSQRRILLGLVELPFDLDELDRRRAAIFDERTTANRDHKTLSNSFSLMDPPPTLDGPVVSIEGAVAALNAASHVARANDSARRLLVEAERARALAESDVIEAERKLANAELALRVADAAKEVSEDAVAELPADPDIDALSAAVADADRSKDAARLAVEYGEREQQVADAKAQADHLTSLLEEIDAVKVEGLKSARMPAAGLSISDDGVLFGGVPLSQCSGAERLRVSLAIAIAANPELRVIRIADGSLLDDDSLELVAEMAAFGDMQIWIEKVDSSGQIGIVIEDGMVVAVNEAAS